jgi:hypothetical protein
MTDKTKIFNSIKANKNDQAGKQIFDLLNAKRNQAMEVRKIALTNTIFNKPKTDTVNEKVDAKKFVLGGRDKIKPLEVDDILSDIQSDPKLMKQVFINPAFQKGGNEGGKNTFKKNTFDWHLFELGKQFGGL